MASPPTTPIRRPKQTPASPTTPFPSFDNSEFERSIASGETSPWTPSTPTPAPKIEKSVRVWSNRETWPTAEDFLSSSSSSMSSEYDSVGSGDEGHSHSETRVPVTSLPINAEIDRMDNFIEKCLKEQIAAKKAEQQVQSGSDIASQCDESTSVASSFAPSSFAPSQVAQSEYQASQASQAPQYQFETPFEGTDFYNFDGNVPLDIETRIPIQLGDFWTARESTTFHSRIPVPAKATSQVPDHSLFAFKNRITMVGSTSMELTKASGGEEDLGDVHDHLKDVYQRIKKMLRSQGKGKQKATDSDSDDSEESDTEKSTPMEEINAAFRDMSISSIASIASSPRPLPGPPPLNLFPKAASSSSDQTQMVLYNEPSSPSPRKPNSRYITQLEQLQSQISPVHSRFGGTTESQAARKLWRQAKLIHSDFPKKNMTEQRIELNALRRAVGMEEKSPVGQSQWQVDAEYRSIINALEKKFAPPRAVRKSISTWIDNTQRALGSSSSPLTIGVSNYGKDSGTEATPKASMPSKDTGYQSSVDVRTRAADIGKAAAAKAAAIKANASAKAIAPTKANAPIKAYAPIKADAPVKADAPMEAYAPIKVDASVKADAPMKAYAPIKADAPIKPEATVKAEQPKKLGNVLTRTSSGRVRLPIIASFREPLTSPEKQALEHRRIRLPTIAANIREPQATPEKSALEHQKLKRYLRRQSTTSIRGSPFSSSKAKTESSIPSPKVAGPGYMSSPRSYFSTRAGQRSASGHKTPSRQAEDVWSEARQRLRGLASMPIAMQRLELGAMRKAAGFNDEEVNLVADEDIIQVYLNEMKVLENMWVGPDRAAREAAKRATVHSTLRLVEEKNKGKEREVVLERTVVRPTQKIGSGKGKERAKVVEEDEGSMAFEDVSGFTSPPSTPTPATKKSARPRQAPPARPPWK